MGCIVQRFFFSVVLFSMEADHAVDFKKAGMKCSEKGSACEYETGVLVFSHSAVFS